MNRKQIIASIAPLILVATMIPAFRLLAGVMNARLAWYIGLKIYWIIWGITFPLYIIGWENIKVLLRPQRPNTLAIIFVSIPLIISIIGRFTLGMAYESDNIWILLLFIATCIGNGFFEEVLWRGVYLKVFPNSITFRMIWPSLCFAAWHYAPGSILSSNPLSLIIGAGVLGLYLSYVSRKTNTIFWSIITHILIGLVQVI